MSLEARQRQAEEMASCLHPFGDESSHCACLASSSTVSSCYDGKKLLPCRDAQALKAKMEAKAAAKAAGEGEGQASKPANGKK